MAPGFGDSSTTTKATVTILVLNEVRPCGKKPSRHRRLLLLPLWLCGCCHQPAHPQVFPLYSSFLAAVSAKRRRCLEGASPRSDRCLQDWERFAAVTPSTLSGWLQALEHFSLENTFRLSLTSCLRRRESYPFGDHNSGAATTRGSCIYLEHLVYVCLDHGSFLGWFFFLSDFFFWVYVFSFSASCLQFLSEVCFLMFCHTLDLVLLNIRGPEILV